MYITGIELVVGCKNIREDEALCHEKPGEKALSEVHSAITLKQKAKATLGSTPDYLPKQSPPTCINVHADQHDLAKSSTLEASSLRLGPNQKKIAVHLVHLRDKSAPPCQPVAPCAVGMIIHKASEAGRRLPITTSQSDRIPESKREEDLV
ncbi:hypothetical protein BT69DRAFT_1327548 [Atractiella rhizophila]|nr:hypothetical protein BT69DRAFT_1327548 [Atractiella rhizophila]